MNHCVRARACACVFWFYPKFTGHLKKLVLTVNNFKKQLIWWYNDETKLHATLWAPTLDSNIGNQKKREQPEKSWMGTDQFDRSKKKKDWVWWGGGKREGRIYRLMSGRLWNRGDEESSELSGELRRISVIIRWELV